MKLHSGLDTKHLLQMLGEALVKEVDKWKPVHYRISASSLESSGEERDEIVSWLICLNGRFHFSPETLALTIAMMDRFLSAIKVRPKYLQCVAISCLYIAAKTLEEDEVIPSTKDLVKTSQCDCAVSDILRMEGVILDKLSWNIKTITAVDYLHIIHALLMCYYPRLLEDLANMTPTRHLTIICRNLFHCLCCHRLVRYRPITLSLAVLSLELEQITPGWLTIINTVLQMAEIEIDSLIQCREVASQLLKGKNMLPTGYLFKSHQIARPKSVKRKAEQVELEDDFYDGIKRLYNDDTPSLVKSCGSELEVDSSAGSYSHVQPVSAN